MCHHSPCRRTQLRPESTVAEKPEPGPRDESLLIVKSGYKLNSILLDFYSQEYIHKVLFSNTIKVVICYNGVLRPLKIAWHTGQCFSLSSSC